MVGRSTAVLALVALSMGAFVYFYELRGEPRRQRARESAARMFSGLEAADIEALVMTTIEGDTARVERRDGGWQIIEPLQFPGDDVTFERVVDTLVQISGEREIEAPEAFEIYGLNRDSRQLRFSTPSGEYVLRFGSKTPVGDNTYVSVRRPSMEAERLYMVPRWRVNSLQRRLVELRDRRVIQFDRSAVRRIEVGWPGTELVLDRVVSRDEEELPQGMSWRITAPVDEPADPETVEDLLSDLSSLRADDFVDDPPDSAQAGLADPAFRATLHLATGVEGDRGGEAPRRGRTAVEFVLGAETGDNQRLARGRHAALYVVSAAGVSDLPRTLAAYRLKPADSAGEEAAPEQGGPQPGGENGDREGSGGG